MLITLEGGCNPDGLRDGARSMLQALIGTAWAVPVMDSPAAEGVIRSIITFQKKYRKSLKLL